MVSLCFRRTDLTFCNVKNRVHWVFQNCFISPLPTEATGGSCLIFTVETCLSFWRISPSIVESPCDWVPMEFLMLNLHIEILLHLHQFPCSFRLWVAAPITCTSLYSPFDVFSLGDMVCPVFSTREANYSFLWYVKICTWIFFSTNLKNKLLVEYS